MRAGIHRFSLLGVVVLLLATACCSSPGERAGSAATEEHTAVADADRIGDESTPHTGGASVAAWIGEWFRQDARGPSSVSIDQGENGSRLFFELFAMSGANVGELSGAIRPDGGRAVFEDDRDGPCRLVFGLERGVLKIEQAEGTCGAGAGVSFTGDYTRGRPEAPGLVELGMVADAAQAEALKRLLGERFDKFLDCVDQVTTREELDGFGAEVRAAGVRGLYTIMEAIVIYDESGRIWAAMIDDEVVRYYTNVDDYRTRLPRTIEAWRRGFKDLEVVFMNR